MPIEGYLGQLTDLERTARFPYLSFPTNSAQPVQDQPVQEAVQDAIREAAWGFPLPNVPTGHGPMLLVRDGVPQEWAPIPPAEEVGNRGEAGPPLPPPAGEVRNWGEAGPPPPPRRLGRQIAQFGRVEGEAHEVPNFQPEPAPEPQGEGRITLLFRLARRVGAAVIRLLQF